MSIEITFYKHRRSIRNQYEELSSRTVLEKIGVHHKDMSSQARYEMEIPDDVDAVGDGKNSLFADLSVNCSLRVPISSSSPNKTSPVGRIIFPARTKYVDSHAFHCAERLVELEFRGAVEHISSFAFAGCRDLGKVDLSKGCRIIGGFAFSECNISTFHATGVKEIRIKAFSSGNIIGNVGDFSAAVLGDMTRLEAGVFAQSSSGRLKNLVIGQIYHLDSDALTDIPALESLTIMGERYTKSDLKAVERCCRDSRKLQRISVPDTLDNDSKAYLQELSAMYGFQLRFFSFAQVSNKPQVGEVLLW